MVCRTPPEVCPVDTRLCSPRAAPLRTRDKKPDSRTALHEWYLTLDTQFRGIPIRGGAWQKLATVLDQIHFPLPGIRLRDGDVSFGFF